MSDCFVAGVTGGFVVVVFFLALALIEEALGSIKDKKDKTP